MVYKVWSYGESPVLSADLNGNFTQAQADIVSTVQAYAPPIGSITSWLKTYATADSGTTDATTAFKLIQSGQNFLTTVEIGMIVRNTSSATYSYVTNVDSDTTLTLAADIITSGEGYIIYKTPYLNSTWVECNGQVLSDALSPYDGETIPDLNGTIATNQRFLRGSKTSGTTGGTETHAHMQTGSLNFTSDGPRTPAIRGQNTDPTSTLPSYYEVVWIMRIK